MPLPSTFASQIKFPRFVFCIFYPLTYLHKFKYNTKLQTPSKEAREERVGEAFLFSLGLWKNLFSEVREGALPGWSCASPSPEQGLLGETGRSHGRLQQVSSGQGLALLVLGQSIQQPQPMPVSPETAGCQLGICYMASLQKVGKSLGYCKVFMETPTGAFPRRSLHR